MVSKILKGNRKQKQVQLNTFEHLPSLIAVPFAEYAEETNPYIKLHLLCNAFEMLTRFCTVIILNDIFRQKNEFPEKIRNALTDKIESPTFSGWKDLLRICSDQLGAGKNFVNELPEFGRLLLKELKVVIDVRNKLAHSGRASDKFCNNCLRDISPVFDELTKRLEFFRNYSIVGIDAGGKPRNLKESHGNVFYSSTVNIRDIFKITPEPDRVYLIRESDLDVLSLFPLSFYGEIFHSFESNIKNDIGGPGNISPMLYFRKPHRKDYLEYTTILDTYPHSRNSGDMFKKFQEIFRLEEWRTMNFTGTRLAKFSFTDFTKELLEGFRGRDKHVKALKDWISKHDSGVLWIHGKPGIGKSAFMAKTAKNLEGGLKNSHRILLAYYFRLSNQDICCRQAFLEAGILTLLNAIEKAENIEVIPGKREEQFMRLLKEASGISSSIFGKSLKPRKIIFLLDGIDEICHVDHDFSNIIFRGNFPGVIWICSGRYEAELKNTFNKNKCDWLFDNDNGLPPLEANDIREVLNLELERGAIKLFERDVKFAGKWVNPFIDTLVKRCEGLPLYLKFLIEDIRSEKSNFNDEHNLPPGLSAYYDELLKRIGGSDISFVMTPLLCVMVHAKTALSPNQLGKILNPFISKLPGWEELLNITLEHDNIMFKIEKYKKGHPFYVLFHDSIRQHLLAANSLNRTNEMIKNGMADFCYQWREYYNDEDCLYYSLRYAIKHLLEAGKLKEIEILSTDLEFIEAGSSQKLIYSLIEDYLVTLDKLKEKNEWEGREQIEEFYRFIVNDSHVLYNYPRLTFQQAINQPFSSSPYRAALKLLESGKISQSWFEWLNKPTAISQSISTIKGHTAQVRACVFSPDGAIIASCSDDKTVRTWNLRTGIPMFKGEGHTQEISTCSFSKDGKKLISGAEDGVIKIWDINTGKDTQTLEGQNGEVCFCLFSPNERYIISIHKDQVIKVRDYEKGTNIYTLKSPSAKIIACSFSREGERLFLASKDGNIIGWDVGIGKELCNIKIPVEGITASSFSPEVDEVVFAIPGGILKLYSVETGKELFELKGNPGDEITCCAFSSDRKKIAAGTFKGKMIVWNLEKKSLSISCQMHSFDITGCCFSPDDNVIISCADTKIKIWNYAKGPETFHASQVQNITSCAVSPDRKYVATGSIDQVITLWDLDTGIRIKTLQKNFSTKEYITSVKYERKKGPGIRDGLYTERGQSLYVRGCSFSPDGKYLLAVYDNSSVSLWNISTSEEKYCLTNAHEGKVWWCSFSPDGKRFLTSGDDGKLKIWKARSGGLKYSINAHDSGIWTCSFSPDGKKIISGSLDEKVKLWDSFTGDPVWSMADSNGWITACSFSPDGRYAVSGSWYGVLNIWEGETGKKAAAFNANSEGIWGALFTSDGKKIVSASEDNTVRIWEMEEDKPPVVFWGLDRIWALDIAEGGRLITAGDASGNIYILRPRGIHFGVPLITAVRLYNIDNGQWDRHVTAKCEWCGERFVVGDGLLGKKIKCPFCEEVLKLNPFKVDNLLLSFTESKDILSNN